MKASSLATFALVLACASIPTMTRAAAPEALCSSATTIFCSGFEEGSFSLWSDYDGNPGPWNLLMSDPGPLNLSSNSVARLRVPAGRGTTDLTKVLPSSHDKLYLRWYQKWESDFDFSVNGHEGGLHAGDRNLLGHSDYKPTGADWFSAWLEPYRGRMAFYVYYRGMYQDCANANGSCWGDRFPCFADDGTGYCTKPEHRERILPPLIQANKWYCFEMMVDAGNAASQESQATGALNYWIDGTEYGPWTGLWFRTTANLKLTTLWLSQFHHAEHSVGGIMLDNVVVSTQRIGCAGGVVLPKPPSNVTAQ